MLANNEQGFEGRDMWFDLRMIDEISSSSLDTEKHGEQLKMEMLQIDVKIPALQVRPKLRQPTG